MSRYVLRTPRPAGRDRKAANFGTADPSWFVSKPIPFGKYHLLDRIASGEVLLQERIGDLRNVLRELLPNIVWHGHDGQSGESMRTGSESKTYELDID